MPVRVRLQSLQSPDVARVHLRRASCQLCASCSAVQCPRHLRACRLPGTANPARAHAAMRSTHRTTPAWSACQPTQGSAHVFHQRSGDRRRQLSRCSPAVTSPPGALPAGSHCHAAWPNDWGSRVRCCKRWHNSFLSRACGWCCQRSPSQAAAVRAKHRGSARQPLPPSTPCLIICKCETSVWETRP